MNEHKISQALVKLAEQLKKLAAKDRLEKRAEERTVQLDPQRVLDFMLFYGR